MITRPVTKHFVILFFSPICATTKIARPIASVSVPTTADAQARMAGHANRRVKLVGAPWCEGINYAGVELGSVALREGGLAEAVVGLGGHLVSSWHDTGDIDFSEVGAQQREHARDSAAMYRQWLASGASVNFAAWSRQQCPSPDGRLASPTGPPSPVGASAWPVPIVNSDVMGPGLKLVHDAVRAAAADGSFVLTVGGDHSIASGSISALRSRYPDLGVLWVNAHADANTPRSSPSGHYHGMAAAHLLGWFDRDGEVRPVSGPCARTRPPAPPPRPLLHALLPPCLERC
jgi:arginase family enzyme